MWEDDRTALLDIYVNVRSVGSITHRPTHKYFVLWHAYIVDATLNKPSHANCITRNIFASIIINNRQHET